MSSTRRLASLVISALMLMIATTAFAQQQYEAGVHYTVLDTPVRTRDASKIEVVEVFWYGCGHCYNFEPIIHAWEESKADDVDFYRSPAMWGGAMKLHAQAYYAAQALKVLDTLHTPLFVTLNVERKRLNTPAAVADLFADYGVDRDQALKTLGSFGVLSQVRQADARARSYKISGTPEVVVNGKYRVSGKMAGGQQQMITVMNYLIAKERAAMAAAS
ncbi:thiol:disulfide interchange protein DsbA/DsbL [Dasania marina]|uniref:thiol:disulfide interchange protein DsbA/DsbL n=1 Tax=Dasania marina TaxID=471499 RepID=UPI00068658F8|nr:thiol:disulfide interchange protein DsbA/DsbL [Dasania marina]